MAACRSCGAHLDGRRWKCDACKRGDAPPETASPKTLAEAVADDDRVESLRALARDLAGAIELVRIGAPAKLGPLAKQLRDTQSELARLAAPKQKTKTDELAERRANRRAGAAASTRS